MKQTGKGFTKSDKYKRLTSSIKIKNEFDKKVFDLVLKSLFNSADKNALKFEEEILNKHSINLPVKEKKRLWNVLINSGWVSPIIGFGNAGKLTLTKLGFQLIEQYGGYIEYLEAINTPPQSETYIVPINPMPDGPEVKQITPPPQHKKK